MQLVIISGTVFGTAEEVAHAAHEELLKAGIQVSYKKQWQLDELLAAEPAAVLFVCSTTGMGEMPPAMQLLAKQLDDRLPDWAGRPYGIIALGDAGYGETFCAAGDELQELAEGLGLVELQEMLRLDASATVTQAMDAMPWVVDFARELRAWEQA